MIAYYTNPNTVYNLNEYNKKSTDASTMEQLESARAQSNTDTGRATKPSKVTRCQLRLF